MWDERRQWQALQAARDEQRARQRRRLARSQAVERLFGRGRVGKITACKCRAKVWSAKNGLVWGTRVMAGARMPKTGAQRDRGPVREGGLAAVRDQDVAEQAEGGGRHVAEWVETRSWDGRRCSDGRGERISRGPGGLGRRQSYQECSGAVKA